MRKISKSAGEQIVKGIKRATRKQYSAEEKIRIVHCHQFRQLHLAALEAQQAAASGVPSL